MIYTSIYRNNQQLTIETNIDSDGIFTSTQNNSYPQLIQFKISSNTDNEISGSYLTRFPEDKGLFHMTKTPVDFLNNPNLYRNSTCNII